MTARLCLIVLAMLMMPVGAGIHVSGQAAPVVVASKPFGESYLLAEMFAQVLESRGIAVVRQPGLGSTEITFGALTAGAVDVYPEYTGTGLLAVLKDTLQPDVLADPRRVFAHVSAAFESRYRARWLPPLGFQNTFAMAVRRDTAQTHNLRSLSDLAKAGAQLTGGFSPDFVDRADGLAGLIGAYGAGIRPSSVRPLLPALKYQAIASGAVDVIDAFSTDGQLARYDLVVLDDDRHFFPPYEAAALVGSRAAGRPEVISALTLLSGKLDEPRMRALNRRVEVDAVPVAIVATDALREISLVDANRDRSGAVGSAGASSSIPAYLWKRSALIAQLSLRHLLLVAGALAAATVIAIPLGLGLERARSAAGPALAALGVLQTIPSIALLAFMVPLLGIGVTPALIALWLYALFPIARGTYTGVRDADPAAVQAAEALGMTPTQRLLQVRLPLAAPVIMAGVRTAAVITVGAATLAAFIGAGGLGEPIVTGLALADTPMILSGALPAAALALLVDGALALVERAVAPPHLKHQ